jgi:hypothetical protein
MGRDVCLLFYTWTRTDAGSKLTSIEVHFTPEQETRRATIAAREDIDPQELTSWLKIIRILSTPLSRNSTTPSVR